jgi:hypothetical protein
MSILRLVLALVAAAATVILTAGPASADCNLPGPLEEELREAPVAFVGVVSRSVGSAATFAVTEVWAGEVGEAVEVRGLVDNPAGPAALGEDDRTWVDGGTYLVLPFVDGGVLRDNICTATTEWRDELAALRPDSAIIREPETLDGRFPVEIALIAIAAAAIGLVSVLAFRRR